LLKIKKSLSPVLSTIKVWVSGSAGVSTRAGPARYSMRRKLVEDKDITSWFHTLTCGIEFFPGAGAGDTGVRICRASNFAAPSLWGIPPPGAGSSFFHEHSICSPCCAGKRFHETGSRRFPKACTPGAALLQRGKGADAYPGGGAAPCHRLKNRRLTPFRGRRCGKRSRITMTSAEFAGHPPVPRDEGGRRVRRASPCRPECPAHPRRCRSRQGGPGRRGRSKRRASDGFPRGRSPVLLFQPDSRRKRGWPIGGICR